MTDVDKLPSDYPQQPQPRTLKSRVIAEFVDEIPQVVNRLRKFQTSWEPQDGLKEGLEKAFRNPGRALILVKYDGKDSPSKRREMAKLRARSLENQGYTERMGWTVRAVEFDVFVMYSPPPEGY